MHSSWMRIARFNGHLHVGVSGGGRLPGVVSAGGVYPGCLSRRYTPQTQRQTPSPDPELDTPGPRGRHPPVNRMTHTQV